MDEVGPTSKLITIVVDSPGWFDPYAEMLHRRLVELGHDVCLTRLHNEVRAGDVAFYLACMRITPAETLAQNRWNLVVHESDLPRGRGFAPLTWAILEGRTEVDACLILATEGPVDSGPIISRRTMRFQGYELSHEIRAVQGETTIELCLDFVTSPEPPLPRPQIGEPTFYPRRRPIDSELDPALSIRDQFNLLRVVDNERYPAFFRIAGKKYVLKIYREGE